MDLLVQGVVTGTRWLVSLVIVEVVHVKFMVMSRAKPRKCAFCEKNNGCDLKKHFEKQKILTCPDYK